MSFEFHKLPDHLILDIFKKVYASDLLNIRLVCRKWTSLVSDSVVLRRKHQVAVTDEKINDEHEFIQTYLHSPYNICANIRFENVILEESEIVTRLWSKIGANIECLSIESCKVRVELNETEVETLLNKRIWLALLRKTPNLIELDIKFWLKKLKDTVYSESVEVTNEFNLKKLRKVKLDSHDISLNQCIMKILIKSPNKFAAIRYSLSSEIEFDTMYLLIESQIQSLKILELGGYFQKKNWQKYLTIDNLSLEVLELNSLTELDSDLLKLLGNQKNLRELTCYVNTREDYKQYPAYLSKLEKLEFCIKLRTGCANYSFPKNLNNLKSLKIHTIFDGDFSIITFETPTSCPTLEVLEFIDHNMLVEISPSSLQSFIDNYPNLRVLNLRNYTCHPRCIAAIADNLLLLEELDLRILVPSNKVKNYPFPKKLDHLKSLKVDINLQQVKRNFTITFEIPTFRPALEVLEITNDDEMRMSPISLQRLVDNFPNLRVLKLSDFRCDALSVAAIAEKLVHLEELELRIHVTNPEMEKNALNNISNLRKLKHLSVFDFSYICDDRFFIEHLRLPALTLLVLFSRSRVKNMTDRGISALIENCPLLKHFHSKKFGRLTKADMIKISERFKKKI